MVSARLALMTGLCRMEREEYRELAFSDRLKAVFKITESAAFSLSQEQEEFDFAEVDEVCLFSLSPEMLSLVGGGEGGGPLREFSPLSFMAIPEPFLDLISECLKRFRGGISPFSSPSQEGGEEWIGQGGGGKSRRGEMVLSGYSVTHSRTPLLVQFLREFWCAIESLTSLVPNEREDDEESEFSSLLITNIPNLKLLYEQVYALQGTPSLHLTHMLFLLRWCYIF